jgi:hypothetical protein
MNKNATTNQQLWDVEQKMTCFGYGVYFGIGALGLFTVQIIPVLMGYCGSVVVSFGRRVMIMWFCIIPFNVMFG